MKCYNKVVTKVLIRYTKNNEKRGSYHATELHTRV